MLKLALALYLGAGTLFAPPLRRISPVLAFLVLWVGFAYVLLKALHEIDGIWKILGEQTVAAAILIAVAGGAAILEARTGSKPGHVHPAEEKPSMPAEGEPSAPVEGESRVREEEEVPASELLKWRNWLMEAVRPEDNRDLFVPAAVLVLAVVVSWLSPATEKAREATLTALENEITTHHPDVSAMAGEIFPGVIAALPRTQPSDYASAVADARAAIARHRASAIQELSTVGAPEDRVSAGDRIDVIATTDTERASSDIARAAEASRASAARAQLDAARAQIAAEAARAVKEADERLMAKAREKLAATPESGLTATARGLAETAIAELERFARAALESAAAQRLAARAPQIDNDAKQGALSEAKAAAGRAKEEMDRAINGARSAATAREEEKQRAARLKQIRQQIEAAAGTRVDPHASFRRIAEVYHFNLCENSDLNGTDLHISGAIKTFEECARACVANFLCNSFQIQADGSECSIRKNGSIQSRGTKQGTLAAVRGGC